MHCGMLTGGLDDDPSDSSAIIKKILSAKLFDEAGEGWKKNVQDIEGEVLCGTSRHTAQHENES